MVKYLLVVVGGLIFLAGYSFMKKNEGSGKTMRIYALFAYAGLSLIILAGARGLDPVFAQMGSWADNIQLAVQAACFVIGAEVLLKPAFEDQKEKRTSKKITSRGSVSQTKMTYTQSKKNHKKK